MHQLSSAQQASLPSPPLHLHSSALEEKVAQLQAQTEALEACVGRVGCLHTAACPSAGGCWLGALPSARLALGRRAAEMSTFSHCMECQGARRSLPLRPTTRTAGAAGASGGAARRAGGGARRAGRQPEPCYAHRGGAAGALYLRRTCPGKGGVVWPKGSADRWVSFRPLQRLL